MVFHDGARASDARFTVLASPNGLDRARLGLAISRKAAALATERNRLKRLARETFRANRERLIGFDLVVMARAAAVAASNAELRTSLDTLYQGIPERCAR